MSNRLPYTCKIAPYLQIVRPQWAQGIRTLEMRFKLYEG